MASTTKDPVLVVLQLSGANDYLNCVVPYTNGNLLRQPAQCANQAGRGDPAGRHFGVPSQHGADEAVLGRGEFGHHPWDRFRELSHGPTSGPWTSGIPASLTKSGRKAGWVERCGTWTRATRTW